MTTTTGQQATQQQPQSQSQLTQQQQETIRPLYEEEEADRLCNQWVETGLTQNKAIQFLISQLESLGCAPPENAFVNCLQCDRPGAGFFGSVVETPVVKVGGGGNFRIHQQRQLPSGSSASASTAAGSDSSLSTNACATMTNSTSTLAEMLDREQKGLSKLSIRPEIFICQQYMNSELHTHKTMVHELIHAIDQCRTKLDPLHNCLHVACTEVRAENLSGECGFWTELPRMVVERDGKFAGRGQDCVRRRAILSVRGNPHCSDHAETYVDAVMERCFADVYPFDRHPNQR